MATVSQWNPFGVTLSLTANSVSVTRTSATQYKVKIDVSWKTYWSGAKTNYGMTASSGGASVNLNTFGVKASSGSGTITGTYSISGNGSASKTITVTFKNYNSDNGNSATKNVSFTVTVPAWTSYTVTYNNNGHGTAPSKQTKWKDQSLTLAKAITATGYTFQHWNTKADGTGTKYSAGASYTGNASITLYAIWKVNTFTVTYNANGGSGAPSSQTKNYGATITLSTTKPTRTGYTFHHWNTKADGSGSNYIAGAYYSSNASVTLYAIWTINTYTITYNANGGTGAPASQTKNYGATLTLSTAIPTKPNYNFIGWATSASATSAEYIAGGPFIANANTTLYAVWELAYYKPKIKTATASRCRNDGVTSSDGTYAHIYVEWDSFETVTSVLVHWRRTSESNFSNSNYATAAIDENTAEIIVGNGSLATDTSYEFRITVTDSDSSIAYVTIPGSVFLIDTIVGGTGVAFGKKADEPYTADFAWNIYARAGFKYPFLEKGTNLNTIMVPNTYYGNAASTYEYTNCPITSATSFTLEVFPAGDAGQIMQRVTACSTTPATYVRHYYSDTWHDWVKVY